MHGSGLLGEFTDAQTALLGQCFPGSVLHIEEDREVAPAHEFRLPAGGSTPLALLDNMSTL